VSTTIEIPGGQATFREKLVRERDFRTIEAASMAVKAVYAKTPDPGITDDMTDDEKELALAAYAAAIDAMPMSYEEAQSLITWRHAAIVAFLESWTLRRPLPTMDTIDDLDRDVIMAMAPEAQRLAMSLTETGHVTFQVSPDLASPTNDSSGSSGPSSASSPLESTPTPISSPSGESTSTESGTAA
jgi:hypothetical protein